MTFYPMPIRDPVGSRFELSEDVAINSTTDAAAGSEVILLVEGSNRSSVQLLPPFAAANVPFDVDNSSLEYVGPGPAPEAPTPVNDESRLTGTVEDAALAEGIPVPILKALVFVESRWSPTAQSPTGPLGLMQFTRVTAEESGLQLEPVDERLDPVKAAPAGARYLRRVYQRFPEATNLFERWRFALGAYNQGRGAVNDAIRAYMASSGTGSWPADGTLPWADVAAVWSIAEGRRYVDRILGVAGGPGGVAASRYGYGR